MVGTSSLLEKHFDWVYFVAISGPEGRSWTTELRSEPHTSIEEWVQQALAHLRQHRIDKGLDLLGRAEALMPDPNASSVASVLYHRYLAVLAYAQYCREQFDAA